jgi:hypothetical protein
MADIIINGSGTGFYGINAGSHAGLSFLEARVEGFDGDTAWCDDTRMAREDCRRRDI